MLFSSITISLVQCVVSCHDPASELDYIGSAGGTGAGDKIVNIT